MRKVLRVGSRPSRLAIKQVEEISRSFPWVDFEIVVIPTRGDKDKITPISRVEGSDFFTQEIDSALLNGRVDLAVHSSKDLPDKIPQGLKPVIETKSISPFDALVSRNNLKLFQLPLGSRVGTSSKRRKDELILKRPDLNIVDIRGDIQERLALLDSGRIDALLVAHAALIRLGLESRAAEIFPLEVFKTHPKQGGLTLIVREENWQEVKSILSAQAPATPN